MNVIPMISKQILRRCMCTSCPISLSRNLVYFKEHTQMYRYDVNRYNNLPNIECKRSLFMSEGNNFSFKPFAKLRLNTRLKKSSCLVYEILADSIDYVEFIKYFRLPDTFESWFLAIAIHVWMTIVVTISEKQGRYFRNGLLESMWQDVEERMNQLNKHGLKSSVKKASLKELVDQFKAAIIAYDEGILSTDMVLAGAVWRMFFGFKDVDPRLLEDMVFYIRRQIAHLDSLHMESLLKEAEISYLPLNEILEEKKSKI